MHASLLRSDNKQVSLAIYSRLTIFLFPFPQSLRPKHIYSHNTYNSFKEVDLDTSTMSTKKTIKIAGAREKDQYELEIYLLLMVLPLCSRIERYFQIIGPDDNWRHSSNLQKTKPLLHTRPFLPTRSGLFKEFLWLEPYHWIQRCPKNSFLRRQSDDWGCFSESNSHPQRKIVNYRKLRREGPCRFVIPDSGAGWMPPNLILGMCLSEVLTTIGIIHQTKM